MMLLGLSGIEREDGWVSRWPRALGLTRVSRVIKCLGELPAAVEARRAFLITR
jgi:hypothetical protein